MVWSDRTAESSPRFFGGRAIPAFCVLVALVAFSGCTDSGNNTEKKPLTIKAKYPMLAPKAVPAFMKGTVFELCDVENKQPYLVAGYGLVVGLSNTGNNDGVPMTVRNYMYDQMVQHGFGGTMDESLRSLKPGRVLSDPRTSIVEVYGFLPPGARAKDRIDIFVQAIATSRTKSLARGMLYLTDLHAGSPDPMYPRGGVNVYAKSRGPVCVTPTYVAATTQPVAAANLRSGTIMDGGMVMEDRPLSLRVRPAQIAVSLAIQNQIRYRFQDDSVARAQDEGLVYLLVPQKYNGDWKHFLGVATHLYMNAAPGFATVKAKELAKEAVKPDAPLEDISYCWEGLGEEAIGAIQSLYGHASPDVAFAAARAGAFLRDTTAVDALAAIAGTEHHPFQLNAIKTLGALPSSPQITRMLSELLNTKNALVRVEAYTILANQEAPCIISRAVRGRFLVDRVLCEGSPLIYATRTGTPRIAVFGNNLPLRTPILFSALDDQFTISSSDDGKVITVFDRSASTTTGGAQAQVHPDLYELMRRLGGEGGDGFAFEYSDLVGILQSLVQRGYIAANFVLQDQSNLQEAIEQAPPIPENVTPSGKPAKSTAPDFTKAEK